MRPLLLLLAAITLSPAPLLAGSGVPVVTPEGVTRGFLELRATDGTRLATGELIQTPGGGLLTSRTVFRFHDGSLHDESVTFSQQGVFRMTSYQLVQRGPRFPHEMEASLDARSGRFTWRRRGADGVEESGAGAFEVPADAVNGLLFQVMRSFATGVVAPRRVSMVLFMPEPRAIEFDVIRETGEPLLLGPSVPSVRYVLRPALGWPLQILAKVAGRTPPDIRIWMLAGAAPAFLKFAGPLYPGGPVWRIVLATPPWAERGGS